MSSPPSGSPGPFVGDPNRRRRRRSRTSGATPGASSAPAKPRRRVRRRLLFVTGGSGFVGRHLVRQAGRWSLIAPGSGSMDVLRAEVVADTIRSWRPDAVIHLAYRKDDRRVIVDGSRNVAAAAAAVGSRLVHLSTDVVFGGGPIPFDEDDVPRPVIDYGADKLAAEEAVAEIDPGAVIVRTSLVYGTDLLSPPQETLRTELRGPAGRTSQAYFTDEYRCPVHADDLAAALLLLADRRDLSGPLHVSGPELVSRHELAVRFATHLGLQRRVDAIRTSTIAESGLTRAGRIELAVGRAAAAGVRCRPVSEVLPGP